MSIGVACMADARRASSLAGWIAYHGAIGAAHIYLCSSADDEAPRTADDHQRDGRLVVNVAAADINDARRAISNMPAERRCDWLIFIEQDEFIVPTGRDDLATVVARQNASGSAAAMALGHHDATHSADRRAVLMERTGLCVPPDHTLAATMEGAVVYRCATPEEVQHVRGTPWAMQLRAAVVGQPRVCIVVHVGYASEWAFYRTYLENVTRAGVAFDFYATVVETQYGAGIAADLVAFGALGGRDNHVRVMPVPNRGLDGGGWLVALDAAVKHARERGPYDLVLKVHTKSVRRGDPEWRAALMDAVAGTPERVAQCVAAFVGNRRLGILGARDWVVIEPVRPDVMAMVKRLGFGADERTDALPHVFIGGTMFWARFDALAAQVAHCDVGALMPTLTPGFPPGETDGHMMERVFGVLAARADVDVCGVEPTAVSHRRRTPSAVESDSNGEPAKRAIAAALAGAQHMGDLIPPTITMRATKAAAAAADALPVAGPGVVALDAAYASACAAFSDIHELLPVLYGYAARCAHVTECIAWPNASTCALMRGMARGPAGRARPRLVGVGSNWTDAIAKAAVAARAVDVSYEFRYGSNLETELEATDLLFIDTWHVYGHLKRELARHHAKVRRWIIMHDTTIDTLWGESLRVGANTAQQARESGYPEAEIRRGVWAAISEFLDARPDEWRLAEKWNNCNGLTVLERVR